MSDTQEFQNSKQNEKPVEWRLNLRAGKEVRFFILSLVLCGMEMKVTFNELGVRNLDFCQTGLSFLPFSFLLSVFSSVCPSFLLFIPLNTTVDHYVTRHCTRQTWQRKEQVKQSPAQWRSQSSKPAEEDQRKMME